jgi:LacI family transcriptional regulator
VKRPTLHDVAAEAKVSIKTVSRVVNDAENVSPEVRERVQKAIEELHYVPNTLARSLKAGRGDTIGVVIDTIADPFFASLTSAVEERALAEGLGTVFGSTGFDAARERAQVERMAMQRVRAVILAPTQGPHDYLRRFETSFPVVMIDRKVELEGYDTVRVDDVGLARRAVAHLADHGHRKIAFVGSDERFVTTRDRLTGYRKALADVGVEPRESWIRPGPTRDVDAAAVTDELLKLTDPPTAILAANPRAAIGVAHALHTGGRADVAFLSFGDFPLARTLTPGVTVVDQNPTAIGFTAMDRVMMRLGAGAQADGEAADIMVDADLIERGSGELAVPA